MHEKWQDLIPFYIAGALPAAERMALEAHLSQCEVCHKALEEWRMIAEAVQDEARFRAGQLPPLSPALRAALKRPVQWGQQGLPTPTVLPNGRSEQMFRQPAVKPALNVYDHPAAAQPQRRAIQKRSWNIITAAAAVMVVVIFGGLVLLMAGGDKDQGGDEVALLITRTGTLSPDMTNSDVYGGSSELSNPDVGILPTISPLANNPPPAPTTPPDEVLGMGGGSSETQIMAPLSTPNPFDCTGVGTDSASTVNMRTGPGTMYDIINGFSPMDTVAVLGRSDNNWYRVRFTSGGLNWIGWVHPDEIRLTGNCTNLPTLDSTGYVAEATPILATPTAGFDTALRRGGYIMLTNEIVGDIAADTAVAITAAWFDGFVWHYDIATQDGRYASALETQLRLNPNIDMYSPTPTMAFDSVIGMGGYNVITLEQVDLIPANTRVRVSSAYWEGTTWVYWIVTQDEVTMAEARQEQLTFAPGFVPGPTPTAAYGSSIGMSGYPFVTRVQVGNIPANTRVRISSGYSDGTDWIYTIVAQDEVTFADARQSELTYIGTGPGPTPAPTATPSAQSPPKTPTPEAT